MSDVRETAQTIAYVYCGNLIALAEAIEKALAAERAKAARLAAAWERAEGIATDILEANFVAGTRERPRRIIDHMRQAREAALASDGSEIAAAIERIIALKFAIEPASAIRAVEDLARAWRGDQETGDGERARA